MSRGVNKAILIGNLGAAPELRSTTNGNAITTFSLATSETWKDKTTGQQQERTQWHRVVIFGRLADIAGQYLNKGARIYIEGKIQTRKWQTDSGEDRYTTEIIANEMQMLGSKAGSLGLPRAGVQSGSRQQQTRPDNDFEDDIPF